MNAFELNSSFDDLLLVYSTSILRVAPPKKKYPFGNVMIKVFFVYDLVLNDEKPLEEKNRKVFIFFLNSRLGSII